jgi:hypothetical protein
MGHTVNLDKCRVPVKDSTLQQRHDSRRWLVADWQDTVVFRIERWVRVALHTSQFDTLQTMVQRCCQCYLQQKQKKIHTSSTTITIITINVSKQTVNWRHRCCKLALSTAVDRGVVGALSLLVLPAEQCQHDCTGTEYQSDDMCEVRERERERERTTTTTTTTTTITHPKTRKTVSKLTPPSSSSLTLANTSLSVVVELMRVNVPNIDVVVVVSPSGVVVVVSPSGVVVVAIDGVGGLLVSLAVGGVRGGAVVTSFLQFTFSVFNYSNKQTKNRCVL